MMKCFFGSIVGFCYLFYIELICFFFFQFKNMQGYIVILKQVLFVIKIMKKKGYRYLLELVLFILGWIENNNEIVIRCFYNFIVNI